MVTFFRLMYQDLLNMMPELYGQNETDNPIVYAVYYDTLTERKWCATEFNNYSGIFYGYTVDKNGTGNWIYFLLDDFEDGKTIRRDIRFTCTNFKFALQFINERGDYYEQKNIK